MHDSTSPLPPAFCSFTDNHTNSATNFSESKLSPDSPGGLGRTNRSGATVFVSHLLGDIRTSALWTYMHLFDCTSPQVYAEPEVGGLLCTARDIVLTLFKIDKILQM